MCPYFTEPLTMATAEVAKTPKADIVNSIIAELKANLPNLSRKGAHRA